MLTRLIGTPVFHEDQPSVVQEMAARLQAQLRHAKLDERLDPMLRAFVGAVTLCGEPSKVGCFLTALSRAASPVQFDSSRKTVLQQTRQWDAVKNFY